MSGLESVSQSAPGRASGPAVEFAAVGGEFEGELVFSVGEVEVGDGLGDGEEAVDVVGAGEELLGDVPGGGAGLGDEADDFRLALAYGAEVAVEEFFVVFDGVAVAAVDEGGVERAEAREADEV